MQKRLTLVFGAALMACLAITTLSFTKVEAAPCEANIPPVNEVVTVPAREDLARFVNDRSPAATRTAFQLDPTTYTVNALIVLRAGDQLRGAEGTKTTVGPATDPDPTTTAYGMLASRAARATASSPSWWKSRGAPTGASTNGCTGPHDVAAAASEGRS